MTRSASASLSLDCRSTNRFPTIYPRLPMTIALFTPTIICLLLFAGCNSDTKVPEQSKELPSEAQVTPAVEKSQTTSVTPSKTEVATSPAAPTETPPVDAAPAEICQRFMDLLKSGNRISAENLLTRSALTMTSKAGLQLEPLGGPTATYEVKETRFATIENKLAQVECEIVEIVDGAEVRSSVTWLVRKQNSGWRIAGLLLSLEKEDPADLLSFENIADVERIKKLAASDVMEDVETRQAAAPGDESKLK